MKLRALILAWLILPFAAQAANERAVFAGGCFWSMQKAFEPLKEKGVLSTAVGFAGGKKASPSYDDVVGGKTGHLEVVEVVFDAAQISYSEILDVYWRNIDPHDENGQFCDKGEQYKTAIFANDQQRKIAEASKTKLLASGKLKGKIATEIRPAAKFYAAEEYHQMYFQKNPLRYESYRLGCGRDRRVKEIWGK